jgi:hypothetical protein
MDGGAQSPQETRVRLILVDDGLPLPRTQIRVSDGVNDAFIDMGYDEPKVGFDYDGEQHQTDRDRYVCTTLAEPNCSTAKAGSTSRLSQNTAGDSSCIAPTRHSPAAGGNRQNCTEGCEFERATP